MARHYKKKTTSTGKYKGFDLGKIKEQCLCILDKYCVCPPKTFQPDKLTAAQAEEKLKIPQQEQPITKPLERFQTKAVVT